jgi:hypothetical protein
MKTHQICASLAALSLLFFALTSHADDIIAAQSGNWSDTNTWVGGIVPGVNDDAGIPSGINVVVDTNVVIQFIYDMGTVTMAANSTLEITTDASVAPETTLDAGAIGNTVIYSANAHGAKPQDYYNLVFDGLGGFYNGINDLYSTATPMTIAGDLTISGTVTVEAGADITIVGNLTIGTTNIATSFDCSVSTIVVKSNITVNGFLLDGDGRLTNSTGGLETNIFEGNITVNPGGTWNVSDVTTWSVGGNFTNHGTIKSLRYGRIVFNGTGTIAGSKAIKIPTMTVNGTYTIADNITLTTNTPSFNGTLIFDLANTNQIIQQYVASTNQLPSYTNMYFGGNLVVINSGSAPASGNIYQLFSAHSYAGAFATTNFPSLPAGLSWVDNTLTSGSIAVTGTILGSPTLTLSRSGGMLTLSWDSATYPGYSVQGQTNAAGIRSNWGPTGSGTTSPFQIPINPANPPVFFRLSNP